MDKCLVDKGLRKFQKTRTCLGRRLTNRWPGGGYESGFLRHDGPLCGLWSVPRKGAMVKIVKGNRGCGSIFAAVLDAARRGGIVSSPMPVTMPMSMQMRMPSPGVGTVSCVGLSR